MKLQYMQCDYIKFSQFVELNVAYFNSSMNLTLLLVLLALGIPPLVLLNV